MDQYLPVFGQASGLLVLLWIIFLPPVLYHLFLFLWMDYVVAYSSRSWLSTLKWTVLEIIPPREIEKSPKLMEAFFSGMSGTLSSISTFDELLKGKIDDRFSLEIVGSEGRVHFYTRVQTMYRNFVESQVYAQYPDAEIIEVEDYVENFPKVIPNKKWDLWGADFMFLRPSIYPIKTYDKFEESVTGEMIDPLSALIEIMGSMGPGQHLWLQYVIVPIREEWRDKEEQQAVIDKLTGREKPKSKGLSGDLSEVFSNIFSGLLGPVAFGTAEKKEEAPLEFRLSPIEKEVLKAVEENRGNLVFRVKMRMLYLGRRESFDKSYVGVFIGGIKQFNDLNLNSFKPESVSKTYGTYLGGKRRKAFRQRKIWNRYKNRNMDDVTMIFSSREMATLFHFPDKNVKSPAVSRVEVKRGAPPASLPVG